MTIILIKKSFIMDTSLSSVFWYLSWPLLILFSYLMIVLVLKSYEKNEKKRKSKG